MGKPGSILWLARARAVGEWLVGLIAVGFACLLVSSLTHSVPGTIATGLLGVWATWRYVAGSPRGPAIQMLWQWEEDLRSRAVVPDAFARAPGDVAKGLGSYGGRVLVMRTKANAEHLFVQLPGGLGTTRFAWSDMSTTAEAYFEFRGRAQLVADVLLREVCHKKLFVPWREEFRQLVPGSVGLVIAEADARRVPLRWEL